MIIIQISFYGIKHQTNHDNQFFNVQLSRENQQYNGSLDFE